MDTNSAYFAKFCFGLGINLKKIVVIGDEESEIVENVRRFSEDFDFVVTSGGIGPTYVDDRSWFCFMIVGLCSETDLVDYRRHDDITYQSIAAAFDLPLIEHADAFSRMKKLSRPHPSQPNFSWDKPSAALEAKKRMIILPIDKSRPEEDQVLFVADDLWVPVSVVNGNIHILPGVPRLFEKIMDGLRPKLLPRVTDPEGKGIHRVYFSTPMAESEVAGFLTQLSKKTEPKGVKVGSYPRWGKSRNIVTLVGRDEDFMESLVKEVEEGCKGRRISSEDEVDDSGSDQDT